MVRNTLDIPMPSQGLNTELSDLVDVPQYTKDELNMDILSDGSRARRLGLEYERGFKLSNISAAESITTEGGQIVNINGSMSCYEWANYKGDGTSIVVVQIDGKLCFFKGINNGVLSDEEEDWVIDLKEYAVAKADAPTMYAWTHSLSGGGTDIVYTDSDTLDEGDAVYLDTSKTPYYNNITVSSGSGSSYTLSDSTTMTRNSTEDDKYISTDYKETPVSFASAYGTLFVCSPYIEVIKIKFKETYTYPVSSSGSCSISLSPMAYGGWGGYNIWNGCTVTIKTVNETTTFELMSYGGYNSGWRSTAAFVSAFNSVPSALRQNFTVTGDGYLTYTFFAPSGQQYNGAEITLNCGVLSTYKNRNWMDGWGNGTYYGPGTDRPIGSVDKRPVVGVISGGTTQNVTVNGYREVKVVSPMVRDTAGIEEPGYKGNDFTPSTLTNEHFYNLLNQGWDGTYHRVDDDTCLPWDSGSPDTSLKIYKFHNTHSVYPSNALSWYVLKDANGDYAPSELANCALGTSLAPRGKMIVNAYSMNRGEISGVSPIAPSPYGDHRPEDITFFAGRLWYALDGRVLYSQIISEDTTLVDKCYQAADPTSEDVSDPIDTDGGVMNIQHCGKILRIASLGTALCVFGDKGAVAILPGNAVGFTPTSYYQQVISSVGTVSKRAVISTGDAIYYWSALGIYRVGFNEQGQLTSENISFGTIHTFFKNLAPVSINNCVAKLNAIKNDIHFMYPTNENAPKQLDAVLKYNIISNTWTPRKIPLTELSSPFIVDAIELKVPINTKPKAIVEVNGETVYVNSSVVEITKKDEDYIGFDSLSYLVIDGDSMRVTFANCTNIEHKDWAIGDLKGNGYDYSSYLITHPILFNDKYMYKQAPYITTTYKRSEEGNMFQSGCFMSAHWGWALSNDSFEWDSKQQTYRPNEFDKYREFVITKTRVRGTGKALQLRFENDGNKDFRLCAIGIDARGFKK